MQVEVGEVGERPSVITKARRNAPQGVVAIGQTLERFTFADLGYVLLDWDDSMERQDVPNPIPVIYVAATKRLPYEVNPYVKVEVRIDVEDVFGTTDDITAANIVEIVAEMERKMEETIARRESVSG